MSTQPSLKSTVLVFGSINMDLVVTTPYLPHPGETVSGNTFFTASGGKGANQAVACARLGVHTRMIGQVGDDVFGATLRASLNGYGVNIEHVTTLSGQSSGVALIQVDANAQNTIVVVPGANGAVGAENLTRLETCLPGATVLLLQLEVPMASVVAAAQAAKRQGVAVILDPAPAQPLPAELYAAVDILTPNQSEAHTLTGIAVSTEDDARKAARVLLDKGVQTVIIKMGAQGVFWSDGAREAYIPAFRVQPVDTVAAGDAFNGALAAALSIPLPFGDALRWALAAGAISVTRAGAQPSMPDRAEVLALLARPLA